MGTFKLNFRKATIVKRSKRFKTLINLKALLRIRNCSRLKKNLSHQSKMLAIYLILLGQSSCTPPPSKPISIGLNPWAGYEFLYLAQQKGFYQQLGIPIEIVQLSSLSDIQRNYIHGRIDGFASTLVEAIQAEPLGGNPLKVSLITDYSHGGDVIISSKDISTIADLKGKTVGIEISALGMYLLKTALEKHQLDLQDLQQIVSIEQIKAKEWLEQGTVDAVITYAPFSIKMLSNSNHHILFSTKEIPETILDTVSLSEEVISKHPELINKLRQAWQLALDYAQQYPEDAYHIMAKRQGISIEEFQESLENVIILSTAEQEKLFNSKKHLISVSQDLCQTLLDLNFLDTDCSHITDIFYQPHSVL